MAKKRNRKGWLWFINCWFIGLFGILILAVSRHLKKEVIADTLGRYIYYNVIMAENTAETLYNCGRDDAMQYPKMVLEIQAQLGPMFKVLM